MNIIICICLIFIHSSFSGHAGCLHALAVVNNAAVNIGCVYHFKLVFCFLLMLGNRIAGFFFFYIGTQFSNVKPFKTLINIPTVIFEA